MTIEDKYLNKLCSKSELESIKELVRYSLRQSNLSTPLLKLSLIWSQPLPTYPSAHLREQLMLLLKYMYAAQEYSPA